LWFLEGDSGFADGIDQLNDYAASSTEAVNTHLTEL
jgi:hypothetical protein